MSHDSVYCSPEGFTKDGLIFGSDTILLTEMDWIRCRTRLRNLILTYGIIQSPLAIWAIEDLDMLWYKVQSGDKIWVVRLVQGFIVGTFIYTTAAIVSAFPKKYKSEKWSYQLKVR